MTRLLAVSILLFFLAIGLLEGAEGQIVVHSEVNGVVREEYITDADRRVIINGEIVEDATTPNVDDGEVLIEGIALNRNPSGLLGAAWWNIRVDKVIYGSQNLVGEEIHVVWGPLPYSMGYVDPNINVRGQVEVFGLYQNCFEDGAGSIIIWDPNKRCNDISCQDCEYYIKSTERPKPKTCSVWTDEDEYNIGETVTIYYSVNRECTAKLTVVLPNGRKTVLGGPNTIPSCTRSKQATAAEPCGRRKVVFETWTGSSASGPPSCKDECYFDVICHEEECSGTISGHVYDDTTEEPIEDARIECEGNRDYSSQSGYYSIDGEFCSREKYSIICSADGYISETKTKTTDSDGDAEVDFSLEPIRCSGTISGYVYDGITRNPIRGASVRCEGHSDDSSQRGYYSIDGEFCSRERYSITCSAEGYKSETEPITTDSDGDYEFNFNLVPECEGTISGHAYDANTREPIEDALIECGGSNTDSRYTGYYSLDGDFCPSTRYSVKCSAEDYKSGTKTITTEDDGDYSNLDFYLEQKCSGSISGHVRDSETRSAVPGASLLVCEEGGSCFVLPPVDSNGVYSTNEPVCPSTKYEITCDAEGYEQATKTKTTDRNGNAWVDFDLESECSGSISGHVRDSVTRSPVPGASLLVCEEGGSCFALPPVDPNGVYSTDETVCPSTRYDITCDAEGYEQATKTKTTDRNGNAWVDFDLESECSGSISGHVRDSETRSPVPGASLLVCEEGGSCFALPPVDSNGVYSTDETVCPSTRYEITCDAEGYEQATKTKTTDRNGNAWVDFDLESECSGSISGHVRDSVTRSPVPGASLLVCEEGGSCFALPPVDSNGVYSTNEPVCPSTRYEITCDAEGYEQATKTKTTDRNGNAWVDLNLEPESSKVKFRGEIVRGGEGDEAPSISFYKFVIKINEVLEDPKNHLKVGDLLGVSSHRSGQARVDTAYNGDEVDGFGEYRALEAVDDDWYGMDPEGCVYLSETPGDGSDHYLILQKRGNQPPKITSLDPDKSSPQEAGTTITWTAKAADSDGDPIEYKFEHKGPSTDGAYEVVRDWSPDNMWIWDTDSGDVGDYEIKVSVHDGKHEYLDDFKSARYTIKSPPDEIKFIGTLFSSQAPMGFVVYYFKVDEILDGPSEVKIGDAISVEVYCSAYPPNRGGSYDRLEVSDRAEVYARIDTSKGKWNDGYEIAWQAGITRDEKYHVSLLPDFASKYKSLAEYWSPVICQDVSNENLKADYILKFDFDGDFDAWNNLENLESSSLEHIAELGAHVYYWVVETETHYFIGYGFFHPFDWKPELSHENDFEGIILCIQKGPSGSNKYGHFIAMKTYAHYLLGGTYSDPEIIEEYDGEGKVVGYHPVVYIEPKGHGVYLSTHLLNPAAANVVVSEIPSVINFFSNLGSLGPDLALVFFVSDVKIIIEDLSDGRGIVYIPKYAPFETPPHELSGDHWPLVNYELISVNKLYLIYKLGFEGPGTPYTSDGHFGGDDGGIAQPPWLWESEFNVFEEPFELFKEHIGDNNKIICRSYIDPTSILLTTNG
jgi:hypothetical protein